MKVILAGALRVTLAAIPYFPRHTSFDRRRGMCEPGPSGHRIGEVAVAESIMTRTTALSQRARPRCDKRKISLSHPLSLSR